VDRLLDEGRATRSAAVWRALQVELADEVPALWLTARPAGFEVMRATLTDYVVRPDLSRVDLKHASRPR
jgi:hypothetical protein